ncbi:MAG: glycosyltransferase, partial [Betaproteobacteria bacterium]|nr:glycosyltransferase [Betaproteobacteria bacterium]
MVTEAEFKPTVVAGLLSVVIPFYNEEAIAFEACRELIDHLTANAQPWELILVDDGSSDRTLHELARAIQQAPQARILQLSKNFKQTAALQAGIDAKALLDAVQAQLGVTPNFIRVPVSYTHLT